MGIGAAKSRIEQLHRDHSRVLYALASRVLGDAAEAEDAVQETFLRAQRSIRLLTGHVHFPWLYRITLNVSIEMIRSGRRRALLSDSLDEAVHSNAPHLDEVIDGRRRLEELCRLADGRDLEILIAHFVHGLDQGEVADNLGISRRAVVKRLARLRLHKLERLAASGG